MKRFGGLFEQICTFDNFCAAARHAQAGKRYRPDVLAFNFDLERNLHALTETLRNGSWQPQPHEHFRIFEPKARWISAAPYEDRVVHHALCNIVEPVFDRGLINDCWGNRRGKGSHRAVLRFQRFAGNYRYVLKADLCKYFPSIDHVLLKRQFRRLFREARLLALLDKIVDGGTVPEPYVAYFDGDDLFTPLSRQRGLPIGNLTSQVWANSYLSAFDHWVKETLGAQGYLRFVDDFALFHDDKKVMRDWLEQAGDYLAGLRLTLHPTKGVIHRTEEGIPFLGYMIWPDRIRVRGETLRRYRHRARRLMAADEVAAQSSLAAWRGHVQLAGSWRNPGLLEGKHRG